MADAYFKEGPDASTMLRFHARRREESLPTVSVLVGPVDTAVSYWQQWAAEAGYRPLMHPRDGAEQVVPSLLDHIRSNCDLPRLALNALLQRAGRPATASTSPLAAMLDGRTLLDLDTLAEPVLSEPDPTGTAVVAHEICRLALQDRLASADLAERLDARLADRIDRPRWRVLRALDELLPAGACPAVLLTAPPDDGTTESHELFPLESVASSLAHFVQTVPTWPLAMALSPPEVDLYERAAADSQAKSLVTTGVIALPAIPARSRSGEKVDPRLLLDAAAEAARAQALTLAAAADAARSDAERLLFQMLESNPITRGHFVLNGSPGFKFGTRQAEVDLLASGLRLAVEIDGYFHFTDPESYRRDRRKDWLLQSHGYTVVRVLAEDVPSRMEKILDFLVSVVEHCRRAIDS